MLLARRRQVKLCRRIGDRQFMAHFSGVFTAPGMHSPLWRWVGNPLLNVYWQIVRRLIWW